ncbi:LuxR C-terminal-related transcriptional regulator [Luteococcus sp.]|uniref:LuxR C-terminal-related transcriptional regulator n=1 Tax=Luteococcus sp. TaxID=1969402 RepID=UPI003734DE2A
MTSAPMRVALVNDHELVLAGLRSLLAPFGDRVEVVDLSVDGPVTEPVDIALVDLVGQDRRTAEVIREQLAHPLVGVVALYTWGARAEAQSIARAHGIDAIIPKSLTGCQLLAELDRVAAGLATTWATPAEVDATTERRGGHDWPGRSAGLTMREAEMISLIAQGYSNAEIAAQAYLSPNSVKSYIRSAYRKIGVSRRSQAVAWGIDNGMTPQLLRIL